MKPVKLRTSVTVLGLGYLRIASILAGLVAIPSGDTTCPKYFNLALKNSHLDGFSLRPASANFSKMPSNWVMWSSWFLEKMIMSSR